MYTHRRIAMYTAYILVFILVGSVKTPSEHHYHTYFIAFEIVTIMIGSLATCTLDCRTDD